MSTSKLPYPGPPVSIVTKFSIPARLSLSSSRLHQSSMMIASSLTAASLARKLESLALVLPVAGLKRRDRPVNQVDGTLKYSFGLGMGR